MKQVLRYSFLCILFITASLSLRAQGIDGQFYSLVYYGGAFPYNQGTINLFDPVTDFDTAVVNLAQSTGWRPYGNFIQLSDGMLYGMTSYGGNSSSFLSWNGTIHRYNIKTGQDTVLYKLAGSGNDGVYSYCTLCHANDDSLYGLTYIGGSHAQGTMFSFNYHTCQFKRLFDLKARLFGSKPAGSLIQASNGILYGMTTNDTLSGSTGTIFSYNPATFVATYLYTFQGQPDGYYPRGNLLQVNDSMLYGLTQNGGVNNLGCLFSFNIHANAEKVLYSFAGGADGQNPEESLMLASDGNLYGTTAVGGSSDSGTIFQYNIALNKESVVYSFKGSPNDGAQPFDDLIEATDGLMYGNTNRGGVNYTGVIFNFNFHTNTETVLKNYDSALGQLPYGDFLEVMSATTTVVSNVCATDLNGSITIHVRGGKPAFTYAWSTGATTSSISSLSSGIYTCSVSDSRGIKFSFQDTVLPLPTLVNFNVSNPCNGDSNGSAIAVISGGTSPFTFTWSNGNTTDTAYNLQPGTYTCSIVDAHNCPAQGIITITQAAPLVINSVVATPITYPANYGTITVTVSGGIPPGDVPCYHYLWSNGAPDSSVVSIYDSGTYAVCITSCYGCGSVCHDTILVTSTGNINNPDNLINVYPVPSKGLITINLNGTGFENLVITDALGREVYTQALSAQLKNNALHINLNSLSDGVYILQVNSLRGLLTRKIIIQK
ncbi:MAG TPA: choice-of-anchor tandem repeat GloVer-containing protein [Bacteroidia bacterium]|jgi:uncharacterized repeat protein (TIGR03803 family)|nr:choice-of-anchor tandem repeat GloVer-containing protein [Bacteroidia bacterium]